MNRPDQTTLLNPTFVGREGELFLLQSAVENSRQGFGLLILVEAESGAGKTRLIEEFVRLNSQNSLRILQGQATGLSPQKPFQALSGILKNEIDPRSDLKEGVWPEQFAEQRLLSRLTGFVEGLGTAQRPAVVILEDCQWADELTLKFIHSWNQGTESPDSKSRHRYVSLIVTFRTEEVPAGHLLRKTKDRLNIRLNPLENSEIQKILQSMAENLPSSCISTVIELAHGNPFLATAVLQGMLETKTLFLANGEWRMDPFALESVQSSREAGIFLAKRVASFSNLDRWVLSICALLGREFDVNMVAALSTISKADVRVILATAKSRHLIWLMNERNTGVFVHDKIREAFLEMLSLEKRQSLHLQASIYLEENKPDQVFDLAYHLFSSGEQNRCVPYALKAAKHARAHCALELAEQNYRKALRGVQVEQLHLFIEVNEGLADVLTLRGKYEEAKHFYIKIQPFVKDTLQCAQLTSKVGDLAFKRGDMAEACEAYELALSTLGVRLPKSNFELGMGLLKGGIIQFFHTKFPKIFLRNSDPKHFPKEFLIAKIQSLLGYPWWYRKGPLPTLFLHIDTLNRAEKFSPTELLSNVWSVHSIILSTTPLTQRAVRYGLKGTQVAEDCADFWRKGQAHVYYAMGLNKAGQLRQAEAEVRTGIHFLEKSGDIWELNNGLLVLAGILIEAGKFQDALVTSKRLHQIAHSTGDTTNERNSLKVWAAVSGGNVPDEIVEREFEGLSNSETMVQMHASGGHGKQMLLGKRDPLKAISSFKRATTLMKKTGIQNEWVSEYPMWLVRSLRETIQALPTFAPISERKALLDETKKELRYAQKVANRFPNRKPAVLRESALIAGLEGREKKAKTLLLESLALAEKRDVEPDRNFELALSLAAQSALSKKFNWPGGDRAFERSRTLLRNIGAEFELEHFVQN